MYGIIIWILILLGIMLIGVGTAMTDSSPFDISGDIVSIISVLILLIGIIVGIYIV